jgi:thiosulfate reductase cytochrome b subunit
MTIQHQRMRGENTPHNPFIIAKCGCSSIVPIQLTNEFMSSKFSEINWCRGTHFVVMFLSVTFAVFHAFLWYINIKC